MDLSSTFKAEVFRPVATLLVPGTTVTLPYLLVATAKFPELSAFWDRHEATFITIAVLLIIACGLILEDIGSRIEAEVLDRAVKRGRQDFDSKWNEYLALTFEAEPVGQRYLRTITLRLKFELAFALALLLMLPGIVWLNVTRDLMPIWGVGIVGLLSVCLAAYLFYEAISSAKVLESVRRLLVESGGAKGRAT